MAKTTTKKGRTADEKVAAEINQRLWMVNVDGLPFQALQPGSPPLRGDDDQNMPGPGNFLWDRPVCQVAGTALYFGLVLSVPVSRAEAVTATAAIVQNLEPNVWVVYDERAGRLLIWDHKPDKVTLTEAE